MPGLDDNVEEGEEEEEEEEEEEDQLEQGMTQGMVAHRLTIEDFVPERDESVSEARRVDLENAHKEALIDRRKHVYSGVTQRMLADNARRELTKALENDDEARLMAAVQLGEAAEIYTDEKMLVARDKLDSMKRRKLQSRGQGITFGEGTKESVEAGAPVSRTASASAAEDTNKPKTALRSALKSSHSHAQQGGHRAPRVRPTRAIEGWLLTNLKTTDRFVPRYFVLDPAKLEITFSDDRFHRHEADAAPWDSEIGEGADRRVRLKRMDVKEDRAVYADIKMLRGSDLEAGYVAMQGGADISRGFMRIADSDGHVRYLASMAELHLPLLQNKADNPQSITGGVDMMGGLLDDLSLLTPIEEWLDAIDALMEHDKYLEAIRTAKPAQLCYRGPNPMNWIKASLKTVEPHIVSDPSMPVMMLETNYLQEFPPLITRLTCLRELWLSQNEIERIDPGPLVALTALELLSLSCNAIKNVPSTLGHCTALTMLMLSCNNLVTIEEGALGKLGNLTLLQLPYNELVSLPDDIGSCPYLERLDANNNRLLKLPDVCSGLTSLRVLHLETNEMHALTPGISSLQKLRELHVSNNQISELPPGMMHLTSLTILKMSHNRIDDLRAPDRGFMHLQSLRLLHAHMNRLLEVPDRESVHQESEGADIGDLTSLTDLRLEGNRINWIPRRVQYLTCLTRLDVSGNSLVDLPVELGKLVLLREVRIESNPFEKQHLVNVSYSKSEEIVRYFRETMMQDISSMKLTKVPETIMENVHLTMLKLSYNRIQILPQGMSVLCELQTLVANHNEIFMLEPWISCLSSLRELALDYNRLMAIPRQVGDLPRLTTLTLERNSLSTVPMELGKITTLKVLRLEKNLLRPPVSDAFEEDGMDGVLQLLKERAPKPIKPPTRPVSRAKDK